jgi:hypothetical protein
LTIKRINTVYQTWEANLLEVLPRVVSQGFHVRLLAHQNRQVRGSLLLISQHRREGSVLRGTLQAPARPFPSSIFPDKNRRGIGKSQSTWTAEKMGALQAPAQRGGGGVILCSAVLRRRHFCGAAVI